MEDEARPVVGFRIKDNGIGLDEANYKSFRTPFSQHKLKKGGKGVGRLGWLKVFERIHVESNYMEEGSLQYRGFAFILREKEQIEPTEPNGISHVDTGSTITLQAFLGGFGPRCPSKTETIVQRIIGHFLPVFASQKSPSMFLHDDGVVDLKATFAEKIVR